MDIVDNSLVLISRSDGWMAKVKILPKKFCDQIGIWVTLFRNVHYEGDVRVVKIMIAIKETFACDKLSFAYKLL